MMERQSARLAVALCFLCACEGGGGDPDGAVGDAIAQQDSGGGANCASGCGGGEVCLRGVCVAACGDMSAIDQALGADVVPIASFCRVAVAYDVQVISGNPFVWDLTATTTGTETEFVVSRWALDPAQSTPAPTMVSTASHTEASADTGVFPTGMLAIDATGARSIFGYTTSAEDIRGEIWVAQLAAPDPVPVPAPANYDSVWLDPQHFVLNGGGLAEHQNGQGLYLGDLSVGMRAIHLATGPGMFSGSIENAGAFILAGGATDPGDGVLQHHVWAIPKTIVDATIGGSPAIMIGSDPNEASEVLDPDNASIASTFVLVGNRLVVTPYGAPMTSYAMRYDPPLVRLTEPRVIATGSTFFGAVDASSNRMLLIHGGGVLLVE